MLRLALLGSVRMRRKGLAFGVVVLGWSTRWDRLNRGPRSRSLRRERGEGMK